MVLPVELMRCYDMHISLINSFHLLVTVYSAPLRCSDISIRVLADLDAYETNLQKVP